VASDVKLDDSLNDDDDTDLNFKYPTTPFPYPIDENYTSTDIDITDIDSKVKDVSGQQFVVGNRTCSKFLNQAIINRAVTSKILCHGQFRLLQNAVLQEPKL
jgi:hypothetical protein